MLYKQKFNTFIRTYNDIGYIINKSNFTDQVTDKIGALFLNSLSRTAKSLQEIVDEISIKFPEVDINEIENDVKIFLDNLEEDGFIVSGQTVHELDLKDQHFEYLELINNNISHNKYKLRSKISTQKYLDNYLKDNPQLMSFQIEITSRCNERCIHCYIPHENKNDDISPDAFYDVLKQCKKMGVMDITLSGGEPMLHPNFLDFLHEAKKNDFSVTVLSNLTLLTEQIISEMKEICLSGFQVSLYSMDPRIHDSITKVPGSFEKTQKAILKLIENNIPIQISCPTMKQNKDSFSEVARWAAEHGMRTYTDCILMARYDHTIDNLENRMSLVDMKKILYEIIENDTSYQTLIRQTDFNKINLQNAPDDIICSVGIMSLCMVSNGNVFPCAGWQSYICGNITNTSLEEIWKYSPQLNYLRNLRKKDLKECVNCSNQIFCSVCMARNANENIDGDPLRINKTLCEIAKLNKDIVLEWKNKYKTQ